MKKLNLFLSALVFIAFSTVIVLFYLDKNTLITREQKEIITTFGNPNQFLISYLPKGDDELVRMEVWYYPFYEIKITFLQGKVFTTEEFKTDVIPKDTTLVPWDIDISASLEEMTQKLGGNVEPVDFMPEFFIPGEFESYISDDGIFTIENNKLTYFQTIGLSK